MSRKPSKTTALVPASPRKTPAQRKPAAPAVGPATADTLLPALRSELAVAKLVGTGGEVTREDGVVLVTGRAYATRACVVPAAEIYYDRESRPDGDGPWLGEADKVSWRDEASGYECIAPQVEISLNYSPVKIYVGSEFPPGSCGYQAILAHEQRHLQAYMDNLARVEKVVREALDRRFEGKPLYAPSGTAMSALEHEINGTWFPYIRDEFEKGKAKQAAIDTPQEYARLSKACDGEIEAILLRRRKNN